MSDDNFEGQDSMNDRERLELMKWFQREPRPLPPGAVVIRGTVRLSKEDVDQILTKDV